MRGGSREDADALLDLVLPSLVHEIRSPLLQLTWNVRLLNQVIAALQDPAGRDQHPKLSGWLADLPQAQAHLQRGLDRLTGLADNLVALAGGCALEALDLRDVVRAAAALVRPVVARRAVVQLTTGEEPVLALGRRAQLIQAVIRSVGALTRDADDEGPGLPRLELAVLSEPAWQTIRVSVEDERLEVGDLTRIEQVCAEHRGRLALDRGPGRRAATLQLPPWSPGSE